MSALSAAVVHEFRGYADDAGLASLVADVWTAGTDAPTRLPALTEAALSRAEALSDQRGRFWLLLARALFNFRDRVLADSRADHGAASELLAEMQDQRSAHLLAACEAALLLKEGKLEQAYALYTGLPLRSTAAHDDPDDVFVLHGRAVCAMSLGRLDESFRADFANLALTQRTGQSLRHCFTAAHLAALLANIGRPEEGIEVLEAPFLRWVRRDEHPFVWTVAQHNLASCKQLAGRAEEAFAGFMELLDSGVLTTYPMFAFNVHENLTDLALMLGRPDEAEEHLSRAEECARASGQAAWIGTCEYHRARIALARGEADEVLARLEDAMASLGKDPDMSIPSRVRLQVGRLLTQCHVERGNHERAFVAQSFEFAEYKLHADYISRGQLAVLQVKHGLTMALQQLEAERAFAVARERNLHQQARRDGLTGLFNRRYLDETLPELINVARRDGHGLAVAMIDLDHFKRVNDTYGHGGGDAVLRAFARIAEMGVRESDVAGRYGGEEFCIVLLNCSRDDAVLRLQEMLATLCATKVEDGGQVIEGLSFSSGVAMFPEDGNDVAALLSLSDRRLYAAKQAGRKRVEATSDVQRP